MEAIVIGIEADAENNKRPLTTAQLRNISGRLSSDIIDNNRDVRANLIKPLANRIYNILDHYLNPSRYLKLPDLTENLRSYLQQQVLITCRQMNTELLEENIREGRV